MDAIFSQLELLSELANSVAETELAARLQSLLEIELNRYCDSKRTALGAVMAADMVSLKKCA